MSEEKFSNFKAFFTGERGPREHSSFSESEEQAPEESPPVSKKQEDLKSVMESLMSLKADEEPQDDENEALIQKFSEIIKKVKR